MHLVDVWRRIMFGFEKARGPCFSEEWVAKKRVAKGGRNHTKKIGKRSQNLLWNSPGRRLAGYSELAQPHEPEPKGLLGRLARARKCSPKRDWVLPRPMQESEKCDSYAGKRSI